MRGHPLRQVGIDGHQLHAEPDAHQKAQKDHPLRLLLKRQQQREAPYQIRANMKVARRPKRSAYGLSRLAPTNRPRRWRRRRPPVRDAKDALRAGVENAVGDKAGADIAGLEQIVEFEKAAQRQQNDKAPQAGRRGQGVDSGRQIPRMDRRRRYRVTHR